MEIKYHIGRKCNLRCSYCHVKKNNIDSDYTDILNKVIGSVDKERISKLLITGGEPTLYNDQIINILNKYKDLRRINIPSNGTNVEYLIDYLLHYKNVMVTISWDGHKNERGFDSFESIKTLFNAGLNCNVLYVINNTNYNNLYNDMMDLKDIVKDVEKYVEMLFVSIPESEYKMDIDIMEKELKKLYTYFPKLNIFKRNKIRKCPIIHNNDYQIEIRDGIIYKGCINYAYRKTTAQHKLGDCSSEIENKCFNCDIDVCQACGNTIVGQFTNSDIKNMYDDEYFNSYYCKFYRTVQKVINDKNKSVFLKNKLQIDAENFILMLTKDCNLRCVYCIERGKYKNEVISKETLNDFIDLIKENKKLKSLMLFGGEPLLAKNIELLNFLEKKIRELNNKIEIVIMTNAQELSEDCILKFIGNLKNNSNKVRVQVSLDNLKDINDKRRKSLNQTSTFDNAMIGIEKLKNIIDYKSISINSVIDYEHMNEFYDWCLNLDSLVNNKFIGGFSIRYDQLRKETLSILEQIEFVNFYEKICKDYLDGRISRKSFKSIMNISNITCNDESIKNNAGCTAGIKSFTISSNGDVLLCHMLDKEPVGKIKNRNIIAYDKIYDIFDKICCTQGQFRGIDESCNHCKDFETCVKCKVSNYILNGNSRINVMTNCKNVKERNGVLRKNNIELSSFKHLSEKEKEELISDIKELEQVYFSNENVMSLKEKESFLKEVLKLKERLFD